MIINTTKNRIIAKKTTLCRIFFSKMLGLMFSAKSKIKNKAMIFIFDKEQKVSIHMFFVFYNIDVLWLNKHKQVVEMKTLHPFNIYYPKRIAKYIIELESGTIKKTKTRIKDKIKFHE